MVQIYSIFFVISWVFTFGLTQSNLDVQCVPLRDCPKLFNLVKKPLTAQTIALLQSAKCGFDKNGDPKVACAQPISSGCKTPDGQSGKCTPARECKSFLDLLQSHRERPNAMISSYLQNLVCKNDDRSSFEVCCASAPMIKQPVISTWTPLPLSLDDEDIDRPSFLPNPLQGQCGAQESNRIIGGKETEMDEFPWTALLEYRSKRGISYDCGGSLISDRYVVTAAHCTDRAATRNRKLINVILGEFDKSTPKDCINYLETEDCADPPLRVPIEKVIIHDQWYSKPRAQINHDIALIRLADSVRFTNFIRAICLPSPSLTIAEKQNLVVTGWGQTESADSSARKLKTTVPMVNQDACIQKYKRNKRLDIGDGEICVGGEEGHDSCFGDSGGPLMFSKTINGVGIWYLVGVVSFGPKPCGQTEYPGIYTYVPKYIDWIYKTVEP